MRKEEVKNHMDNMQGQVDSFVEKTRQVHHGDGVAVKIKRDPRKKLNKSEVRNG